MAGPRNSDTVSTARSVASTSKNLLAFLKPAVRLPQTPAAALEIPPLLLPSPDELIDELPLHDLPSQSITAFSRIARKAVDQLQSECRAKYVKTCQSITVLPNSKSSRSYLVEINKTYVQLYKTKHLPWLVDQLAAQLESRRAAFVSQSKKHAFNAQYIPVLEKYFEYNAYPTAQDRVLLARKSMMSTRQIEVWFQNHRRRAKKEGKTLQRPSPDSLPVQICLDALELEMAPFVVRKRERSTSAALEDAQTRFPTPPADPSPPPSRGGSAIPHQENILDSIVAPLYAYPTKFTDLPNMALDPFPCKRRVVSLPKPVWAPKSQRRPKEPCSVAQLCDTFITMRISGPPIRDPSSPSWYSSRSSGPIIAPHPALVRPPASPPSPLLQPSFSASRKRRAPRSVSDSSPRSNKRRKITAAPERRVPSSLATNSRVRASSNSSISSSISCSDLETPESSPYVPRTMTLPLVYGVDEIRHVSSLTCASPGSFTAFESYASLPRSFAEALSFSLSISRASLSAP